MNDKLVERIGDAVLYEGYILYPYRPSVKNRQRWTFGGICPRAFSEAQGGTEPCTMQTQVLVLGSEATTLAIRLRFLHITVRNVGRLEEPLPEWPAREPPFQIVDSLDIEGKHVYGWEEAVEREVTVDATQLGELTSRTRGANFSFDGSRELEPLRDGAGQIVAVLVRERNSLEGSIELTAEQVRSGVFRLTVLISNRTPLPDAANKRREEAMRHALVSTHTSLGVQGGEFVSLMDPPAPLLELAGQCQNIGAWPVLVGENGEKDTMLSSPIILYDYPEIAPESPGDLFDGTEIDELLNLRIMTLTDDEKREMADLEPQAAALLQRTESLAREQLMNLHGAIRGLRPVGGES